MIYSHPPILFRADAGPTTGFGHFVRSLALASYLSEDFQCSFATYNAAEHRPSEYQLEEIARVCKYIPIRASSMQEYDDKFVEMLTGKEIVVLDNYYFTTDYQQRIKDKGCKLVCIDDMPNRHFVADVLLTSSPIERSKFSLEDSTKFLSGVKYALLRTQFLNAPPHKGSKTKPGRIIIAIGGADPFRLTDKLLGVIATISHKFEVDVIAGDTVKIDSQWEGFIRIHRRLSGAQIADLFTHADLGIFSASTICIEAIACGLPVAGGWYVDNQKTFYDYGVANGLFFPLGSLLESEEILGNKLRKAFSKEDLIVPVIDFNNGKLEILEIFKTL